jgi:hypothetical protein
MKYGLRAKGKGKVNASQAKSLLQFAKSLRKQYALSDVPENVDPDTGRRRPLGYYLQDYFGKNRVKG